MSVDETLPPSKSVNNAGSYTFEEDAKAKVLCDLGLFTPGAYLIVEYASRCIGESPKDDTIVLPTRGPMDTVTNTIRVFEAESTRTFEKMNNNSPDQHLEIGSIDMSAERLAYTQYTDSSPGSTRCLHTGRVTAKRSCTEACHHMCPLGERRLIRLGFGHVDKPGLDSVRDFRLTTEKWVGLTTERWIDTNLTMSPNSEPANKAIYCEAGNEEEEVRDDHALLFSFEQPPPAGMNQTIADLENEVAYIGLMSFTDRTWSISWYPYANYVSENESLYHPTHFYVCDDWLVLRYTNEKTGVTTLKRVSISMRFRAYCPH